MAISAVPIIPVGSISGNQFRLERIILDDGETFKAGTPVSIRAASGGIQAWDGTTGLNATLTQGAVCGIVSEDAYSLASAGLGAPAPMQPYTGVGSTVTFGSVQNQASAANIAHGSPFQDGRVGVFVATTDTIFSAMFGNAGNKDTPAVTDVGKYYGLTIDSDSKYWYVDKSKITQATNTVVKIIALDPRTAAGSGTLVFFQFDPRYVDLIG